MTTANPYFLFPFAAAAGPSDVVPINPQGGGTGPMSYQYGFTVNYEEDLNSVAGALPIPRPQFNQLMLDITTAVQQLQLQGTYPWVAPASGSPLVGGPANYPLYARVTWNPSIADPSNPYGFQVWESQVSSNTSIPGTDSNWLIISRGGIAPGTYIDSASPNGYPGALLCDGSNYNRADYPLLFKALTVSTTCVTVAGSNVITVSSDIAALISPLGSQFGNNNACQIECSQFPFRTHVANSGATTLTLTENASNSGTFDILFLPYNYGTDIFGSLTTFGVPDARGMVSMASGNSSNLPVIGSKIGNTGGSSTYQMQLTDMVNHTHNYEARQNSAFPGEKGTTSIATNSAVTGTTTYMNGRSDSGTPDPNSAQTNINIIQNSTIVFRYIKY